jgi:hypothetical protein
VGTIEIILAIVALWVAVAVVFAAGVVVGHCLPKGGKLSIPRRGKTTKPLAPQSPVSGVSVVDEKRKIVLRAKQEFSMSDREAEKFADTIIAQGVKELGRLHTKG